MTGVSYRIGQLSYLSARTSPGIAFATAIVARYMSESRPLYWTAAKRIQSFLRGTVNLSLTIDASDLTLHAYAEADWAGGAN